ncbi:MAG: DUF389 domain-containing protein [Patescibacteria group bacterium]|jgi:uncharacterized hydrophobic protein (TIGR00271 family)
MIKITLPRLFFLNDIQQTNETEVLNTINHNSRLSVSFILLLVSSTIICTLGLLLNNSPVIIGGMIISPIMWALSKISIGISYERRSYLQQGLLLLIIATFVGFISSYLITVISPVKVISSEILSRTNPTLLDLIIAFAAGAIAALAITQPKISESLAGVAIATSLTPPLCVSGIGLALSNLSVFTGSYLLYLTNVLSIIFVSVLAFIIIGIKRNSDPQLYKKSISVIATLLILISIPLYLLLQNYSFKILAFDQIEETLTTELQSISPSIHLQDIDTRFSTSGLKNLVVIEASVLLPENISINFKQQENILKILENKLKKNIDLQLKLQRTLSIKNRQNMEEEELKKNLRTAFESEIHNIDQSLTIDSLDIFFSSIKLITLNAVIRADAGVSLTYNHQKNIESSLTQQFNRAIALNLEALPRIKLKSQPDLESDQIKKEIVSLLQSISGQIEISSINLKNENQEGQELITVDAELKKPDNLKLTHSDLEAIKNYLEYKYQKPLILNFKVYQNTGFSV